MESRWWSWGGTPTRQTNTRARGSADRGAGRPACRSAVAVGIPAGVRDGVGQFGDFGVGGGELQGLTLEARAERGGGVGARLMDHDERLAPEGFINHARLPERGAGKRTLGAVDVEAEDHGFRRQAIVMAD